MIFCVHGSVFSLQLIVSALKCAGLHLMWAKVNAVNSTPTQVFISYCRKAAFFFFKYIYIWNVLLIWICTVRPQWLLPFCLDLFNRLSFFSPLWDYFHLFFRFCFSQTENTIWAHSLFASCLFLCSLLNTHMLSPRGYVNYICGWLCSWKHWHSKLKEHTLGKLYCRIIASRLRLIF